MAQWTYRSGSFVSAGNASGGDLTLNRPTGTADGDLVVINVYFEPDTTNISITGSFTSGAVIANTGAFKIQQFWRIASGEPTTYTISNDTAGNQWRAACGVAYQSGTGSGNFVDVTATAQGDGQLQAGQTAPSVTTTGADRLLVFSYGNFGGADPTSCQGAATTLRGALGGTCISDIARATAGATGTTNAAGTGTQDYAAIHIAYISDLAGGATSRPTQMTQARQAVRQAIGGF